MNKSDLVRQHLNAKLDELAVKYGSPAIMNWKEGIYNSTNANWKKPNAELRDILANTILDSHTIQLQPHQVDEYMAFWTQAVDDARTIFTGGE